MKTIASPYWHRFGSPLTMTLASIGFLWTPACFAALICGIAHSILIWKAIKEDERDAIRRGEIEREAAKKRLLAILERVNP